MSPIAGFTRFRRHQVGIQSALLTAVAATRVVPYRGAIVVNPARTDPDVDVGSLDPVLAPFSGAKEVTGTWEGKQDFDNLQLVMGLSLKGGVTATGAGAAKTWTFQAASLTADDFDYVTDEWGDDQAASDGIRAYGGVINTWTLGFGDDLGAYDLNAALVYADADLATDRTAGLDVNASPIWVYGADTEFYLDTAAGSIGSTKWADAIHSLQVSYNGNLDRKRFANGSNTRFQLAGFGRGARELTYALTVAKTADTMAEAATLDDDPVPDRFIEVKVTSPSIITGSTPYSFSLRSPVQLVSRSDGEIGGNTTMTLTYKARYNSTLTYAVKAVIVNAATTL